MDKLNPQFFYGLGFHLGKVQSIAASTEKLNNWRWSRAIESAKEWAQTCSQIERILPKTKKAGATLNAALEEFSKLLGQDRLATSDEDSLLYDAINQFYKVFEQEMEDANAFIATPIGAYSTSVLLKNASSHLSQHAQEIVNDGVKEDVDKAGSCLVFDLWTACGFHALRAVEAEAQFYHEEVTGVELNDVPLGTLIYGDQKNYPGSGLLTQHAKEGSSHESPLGLIISLLSQINAIYRRPIMHPKMSLGANEAKFVFDTAAIAISAMVTDALTRYKASQKAAVVDGTI
jgi:hypothetical protein